MRKIRLICIILIMMLILMNTSVYASNIAALNIRGPDTAKRGSEVEVVISVTGTDKGVQGIQGTLKYDRDVLEFKDKQSKNSSFYFSGYNDSTGIFLLELTNSTINSENSYIKNTTEEIASFKMKVKNAAKLGDTKVELSDLVVVGADKTDKEKYECSIKIVDTQSSTNPNNEKPNTNQSGNEQKEPNKGTIQTTTGEKLDKTQANKNIPQTGEREIILVCILVSVAGSIVFFVKYEKYKIY